MSKENIVSYTAEEVDKLKSETDWDRLNNMTEEEIEAAAASDPDAPPITDWSDFILVDPTRKKAISIRLDAAIVDYFKKDGPGYQSRINQVLRHYWLKAVTREKQEAKQARQKGGGVKTALKKVAAGKVISRKIVKSGTLTHKVTRRVSRKKGVGGMKPATARRKKAG